MRYVPLLRNGPDRRPPPRPRHVQPLATRSTWIGGAARWAIRQGLVSLALSIAGMLAFTVAAFLLAAPLGFAVFGLMCWFLEYSVREDHP